jgi:hypothetical protein
MTPEQKLQELRRLAQVADEKANLARTPESLRLLLEGLIDDVKELTS